MKDHKENFFEKKYVIVCILTLSLGWIMSFFAWMGLGILFEYFEIEVEHNWMIAISFAVGHAFIAGMTAKQVYEDDKID